MCRAAARPRSGWITPATLSPGCMGRAPAARRSSLIALRFHALTLSRPTPHVLRPRPIVRRGGHQDLVDALAVHVQHLEAQPAPLDPVPRAAAAPAATG